MLTHAIGSSTDFFLNISFLFSPVLFRFSFISACCRCSSKRCKTKKGFDFGKKETSKGNHWCYLTPKASSPALEACKTFSPSIWQKIFGLKQAFIDPGTYKYICIRTGLSLGIKLWFRISLMVAVTLKLSLFQVVYSSP